MAKNAKSKKRNKNTKRGAKQAYQSVDEGEEQPSSFGRRSKRNNSTKNKIDYRVFDDENYEKLQKNLDAENLVIIDMSADGNCLFRSLSDQLYGDYGNRHSDVRETVCDYMEKNEADFIVFLVFEDEDDDEQQEEDARDFDHYIESMRQEGEWGGNLEVVAAARLYQRKITVYSETLAAFTIDHGGSISKGPDLHVSYHGNEHYNSVRSNLCPPKPSRMLVAGADNNPLTINDHNATQVKQHNNTSSTESEVESSLSKLSLNESEETDAEINTKKNIKRSAPCPCGSGLRYKKCCLPKVKHSTRIERLKAKNHEVDDGEISDLHEGETMSSRGMFQVVSI